MINFSLIKIFDEASFIRYLKMMLGNVNVFFRNTDKWRFETIKKVRSYHRNFEELKKLVLAHNPGIKNNGAQIFATCAKFV